MHEGRVVGGGSWFPPTTPGPGSDVFKALQIRKGRATNKTQETSLAVFFDFYSVVCQVFYVVRVLNTLKNEEK